MGSQECVEPIVTCDTCGYLLTTMQDQAHNPLHANAIGMVIMQLPYVIIKVLLRYQRATGYRLAGYLVIRRVLRYSRDRRGYLAQQCVLRTFYAVECGGASEEKLAQMREILAQVRKLHSLAPNLQQLLGQV